MLRRLGLLLGLVVPWTVALPAATMAQPDARCADRVDFYHPPEGMVGDPAIAARIAEIYLSAIYGAETIANELPLKVSLENEVWHITGKDLPPNTLGGVAEIDICRSTGQVLRVVHGR